MPSRCPLPCTDTHPNKHTQGDVASSILISKLSLPPEQHRIRTAGLREIDKAGHPGKDCPRAEPFNSWGYFCPLEVARKWKLSFQFSQKGERTAYGVSKNKKCLCETVPDTHLVGCVASREKWCLGIIGFLFSLKQQKWSVRWPNRVSTRISSDPSV